MMPFSLTSFLMVVIIMFIITNMIFLSSHINLPSSVTYDALKDTDFQSKVNQAVAVAIAQNIQDQVQAGVQARLAQIQESPVPSKLAMPYMRKLANQDTFLDTLDKLYHRYGVEIAAYRPVMRKWCKVTNSCKFGDYEAEMLYMLVREHKPQNVFEMAPNRGYSTHWILKALHLNDNTSKLHSFDIHKSSVEYMDDKYKPRWIFTLGDYSKLYDEDVLDMDKFDFLFVDALHEPEFARGYCKRLFANHKRKNTIVAIHDIVADKNGGGRESAEVYKYLAMAGNARNVFTMSRYAMPNNLYKPQTEKVLPILNQIRIDVGIVKPCDDNVKSSGCVARHDHDYLYFENNDAPTIFFTLN